MGSCCGSQKDLENMDEIIDVLKRDWSEAKSDELERNDGGANRMSSANWTDEGKNEAKKGPGMRSQIKFTKSEKVSMRQNVTDNWQEGIVTQLIPLNIRPVNERKGLGREWNYVKPFGSYNKDGTKKEVKKITTGHGKLLGEEECISSENDNNITRRNGTQEFSDDIDDNQFEKGGKITIRSVFANDTGNFIPGEQYTIRKVHEQNNHITLENGSVIFAEEYYHIRKVKQNSKKGPNRLSNATPKRYSKSKKIKTYSEKVGASPKKHKKNSKKDKKNSKKEKKKSKKLR